MAAAVRSGFGLLTAKKDLLNSFIENSSGGRKQFVDEYNSLCSKQKDFFVHRSYIEDHRMFDSIFSRLLSLFDQKETLEFENYMNKMGDIEFELNFASDRLGSIRIN